jgi:uncharacterized SAM-binding protein YcdF (DUF218 family)
MHRVVRKSLLVLAIAAATGAGGCFVYGGRYLQHEEALRRADAVFVLAGGRLERGLEAVDLYREGYAPVIVLSPGGQEPAEVAARARGIRFPAPADIVAEVIAASGVPRSAVIIETRSVDNTADEALMLRTLTTNRGWRTVIVVTSKYHTRRAGYAMRRALEGTGVDIVLRASRYDPSNPARWWRARRDVRLVAEEWQKLIAYRLGLAE